MYDELELVKFQYRLFNKYRFYWWLCGILNGMFIQSLHLTESVNWGNLYVKLPFVLAYASDALFIRLK